MALKLNCACGAIRTLVFDHITHRVSATCARCQTTEEAKS